MNKIKLSQDRKYKIKWIAINTLLFLSLGLCMYQKDKEKMLNKTLESERIAAIEKKKFNRLLRKHGLLWDISIITVMEDGSMWFERGGKLIKFK